MIDHSNCSHPRTSSARAKCRRQKREGGFHPPFYSLGPPPAAKRTRTKDEDDDNYGQTPHRRDLECDNCGVERIVYRGTDPITGVLRFVGQKCLYTIKRSDDLEVLP